MTRTEQAWIWSIVFDIPVAILHPLRVWLIVLVKITRWQKNISLHSAIGFCMLASSFSVYRERHKFVWNHSYLQNITKDLQDLLPECAEASQFLPPNLASCSSTIWSFSSLTSLMVHIINGASLYKVLGLGTGSNLCKRVQSPLLTTGGRDWLRLRKIFCFANQGAPGCRKGCVQSESGNLDFLLPEGFNLLPKEMDSVT